MNFADVTDISIPQGALTKITSNVSGVIWEKVQSKAEDRFVTKLSGNLVYSGGGTVYSPSKSFKSGRFYDYDCNNKISDNTTARRKVMYPGGQVGSQYVLNCFNSVFNSLGAAIKTIRISLYDYDTGEQASLTSVKQNRMYSDDYSIDYGYSDATITGYSTSGKDIIVNLKGVQGVPKYSGINYLERCTRIDLWLSAKFSSGLSMLYTEKLVGLQVYYGFDLANDYGKGAV